MNEKLRMMGNRAGWADTWQPIGAAVRDLCNYVAGLEVRLAALEEDKEANTVTQNVTTVEKGASVTGINL